MTNKALIEELKKAEKGSTELDARIVALLNNAVVKRYPPSDNFGPHDYWQFWSKDGKHFLGSESKFPIRPHTTDLQCAVDHIPEKWLWRVLFNGKCYTFTMHRDMMAGEYIEAEASTPALAVWAGILQNIH